MDVFSPVVQVSEEEGWRKIEWQDYEQRLSSEPEGDNLLFANNRVYVRPSPLVVALLTAFLLQAHSVLQRLELHTVVCEPI